MNASFFKYYIIIFICLFTGPFVSALANRYGFRLVSVLGSIIACAAFTISTFATNVEFLIFWYGIIGGKIYNSNFFMIHYNMVYILHYNDLCVCFWFYTKSK